MSLKRGTVFGIFVFCLVLGPVAVSAQSQGVPARMAQLETQLGQALATITQLQAALAAETSARQAADATLQANINAMSGGGVTQAALDAAIGTEAAARAAADTSLQGNINSEAAARAAFDATLAPVSALAPYVTVNAGTMNDLAGPHVIFTGVNVHIRSGHVSGNSYTENGKGNLILGYNEPSGASPAERGGSHNLVVGPNHRYNFGVGLIMGGSSRLGGDGASVSGGFMNAASGYFSSVSAGVNNEASGQFSNVSAGLRNVAGGDFAAVSGGSDNIASGNTAAVSAGQLNQATGDLSSVSGGFNNVSSAPLSAVGGGSGLVNAGPSTFVP
jgi:hypothetical protein